jgi:hypothetical protein
MSTGKRCQIWANLSVGTSLYCACELWFARTYSLVSVLLLILIIIFALDGWLTTQKIGYKIIYFEGII